MSSNPPSGASTPNPRFKSQTKTVEDVLATQTVGLVALSDFRKRRAEALEQKERDAQDAALGRATSTSGTATPSTTGDGASSTQTESLFKKKKKRKVGTPKLSFGVDDEGDGNEEAQDEDDNGPQLKSGSVSRSQTTSPAPGKGSKIAPNASVGFVPKAQTKRSLLQESQTRETLRKEFLVLQERVKATEIAIPFVFYDGSNIPGGLVRVKKGDFVWVALDGSRKVGAGLGVGGKEGEGAKARREWAKIGVDDLMLVRGELIIPHHYDFYYFIMNRTLGPNKRVLFDYSSQPPSAPLEETDPSDLSNYNPLSIPSKVKAPKVKDVTELEGASDDPTFTKVVDRRWYERNKHIFPASVWQEFDPEKDYQSEVKRDVGGNAFFFS